LSAANLDPMGSRMLDSIKATLTRVLGPESAQVVGFYVDNHLALKDPGAFEQALTDFLGSQAGGLLIDAIKSDLRGEKSGMPEPVSRFLSNLAQSTPNRPPSGAGREPLPKLVDSDFERFVKAAKLATETGVTFKDLVTEGLIASQGETCGCATLACLGRKALDDPVAFAERVVSIFSLSGITILEGLTAFCETKAKARQLATL
jgi:hypothetical protein